MKNSLVTMKNYFSNMKKKDAAFYFILFFSLAVFVLLLVLLGYSVNQYMTFKKTQGSAVCLRGNVCVFTFDYIDSNGNSKTYPTKVTNYYGEGNYTCNVYYKQSGDTITDVVIPSFSYTIFLGTVANITILSVLSFFAMLNFILSIYA
jgi:hypothetical protein